MQLTDPVLNTFDFPEFPGKFFPCQLPESIIRSQNTKVREFLFKIAEPSGRLVCRLVSPCICRNAALDKLRQPDLFGTGIFRHFVRQFPGGLFQLENLLPCIIPQLRKGFRLSIVVTAEKPERLVKYRMQITKPLFKTFKVFPQRSPDIFFIQPGQVTDCSGNLPELVNRYPGIQCRAAGRFLEKIRVMRLDYPPDLSRSSSETFKFFDREVFYSPHRHHQPDRFAF